MKKIVCINNIPSPYSVDLYRELQNGSEDFEFHIVFTSAGEGNRNWSGAADGLDHVTILQSRVLRLKTMHDQRFVHFPGNISAVLDQIDPDAVIAKEYNPSALSSLVWCRRKKRKYIHVTEGTLHSERHLNPVQILARKAVIRNADLCIAASTKAKEKLLFWGCREDRARIAYLTFDLSKAKQIPRSPKEGELLFVGSLAERKGVDLLIRAIAKLGMNVHLTVAGNGSEAEQRALEALAESLGVSGLVEFTGYLEGDALYRRYAEASIFVLPTREDCFGLVLLEAYAAGVPIVSSIYADGAYDIVQDGINGKLADPYSTSQFAGAIRSVMLEKRYEEAAAKNDCTKFELRSVAAVYYDALYALLENRDVQPDNKIREGENL
ncbi:MAG: glycosyltransferase family 4 protein [Solobacterium sp.]|nr:glycosyltransferase family 4 protein [Solobacterium sp.]